MRQPKPTHEKRKPRLSPNKFICSTGNRPHKWNLHFYQIQNMDDTKKGYTYSVEKKPVPLIRAYYLFSIVSIAYFKAKVNAFTKSVQKMALWRVLDLYERLGYASPFKHPPYWQTEQSETQSARERAFAAEPLGDPPLSPVRLYLSCNANVYRRYPYIGGFSIFVYFQYRKVSVLLRKVFFHLLTLKAKNSV